MSLPSDPAQGPVVTAQPGLAEVPRSTARDTWRWLWPDTAFRLVPFAAAAALYARFWGGGAASIGLTSAHLPRDLVLGVVIGVPLAAIAILFRRWVAPWFRLPTAGDQLLQTFFYLAMNAPAEELFWRGTVQSLAILGMAQLVGSGGLAAGLGWAATTAVFGAYHRLGKWSWRAISGVTAAGGVFGLAYLLQPAPQSIWLPVVIHGLATAAFLSWGDVALYAWVRHGRKGSAARAG